MYAYGSLKVCNYYRCSLQSIFYTKGISMAALKITHEQLRDELESGNTKESIAKKYDMSVRVLHRRVARLKATGYDPDNERYHKNPEEHSVKGYSTLVRLKDKEDNSTGRVLEWVKTNATIEQLYCALSEAIESLSKPITNISKPKLNQKADDYTDIIPWFNIGDGHFGMLAYDKEVGQNFNLDIAERELCAAMWSLIESNGGYERCVIQDMGDMTHYENLAGVTEGHGHNLDCDNRYSKMIKMYLRVMHFLIDKALAHFKYVDVIINQGNHSRKNDMWMNAHLKIAYGKINRVKILDNDNVFIPYRMGNTFVMSHHSDKCRPPKLGQVMMHDYRQDFGETKYHYIDIGHIHHNMVRKEHENMTIESFNQLATSDAYAHDGGWRSRSCLIVIKRSKTYGEKGRETLTLEEVRDRLESVEPGTNAQKRTEVYTV